MIDKHKICGLLLAAGLSTRMGAVKMNLPLADGHTVLEHATESMLAAGLGHVVLVLGGHEQEIRANYRYAGQVTITVNPDYEQGMFTSIRAGLRAIARLGDFEAFLLQPGDIPETPPGVADQLARAFEPEGCNIVLPQYREHSGHPALYAMAYAPEILGEDLPQGMRTLLARHERRVRRVPVDHGGVLNDLDTPQDYQRLLQAQTAPLLRPTRSVCPVCLQPLPAQLRRRQGVVYMEKTCPEHGSFAVPVWRDKLDMEQWRGPLPQLAAGENERCPQDCGICPQHQQGSCCVLLEVTRRCDLNCRFCFAQGDLPEPSLEELKQAVDKIIQLAGQPPLLQLSGGEPSLRDDLPDLVAYAKAQGCKYVQLNSNGLRLAQDEDYARRLAQAGLSFVFLQFDGVDNQVYKQLRRAPLLKQKLRAIEVCDKYNLGVTLVPTVVRGVNEGQLGEIIRLGASLSPAVRGVHFQPVSYFGRYPENPSDDQRYTLDELVRDICYQAAIPEENLLPSRCDHPLCGCHASFVALPDHSLLPLSRRQPQAQLPPTCAEQNREYVGRHWQRQEKTACCCGPEADLSQVDMSSLEGFAQRARSHGFTITAMAFQDAMNLDVERLRRCSLHVYDQGKLLPFCSRYLTPVSLVEEK